MPAADESGLAPVNGVKIYYAIFNETGGRLVILLHGGLGNSEDWGFEVPLLARTHEVVVIDCRGRGRSTMSNQPITYELMTSALLGVMDTLDIPRASIVGWSDGGIIGLILAMQHPDRIDRLFAFGANFSHSGDSSAPPDSAASARYIAKVRAD